MYFDGVSYRLQDEQPPVLPSSTVPNGIFTRYSHLNSTPANIQQPRRNTTTTTWRDSPISSASVEVSDPRRASTNYPGFPYQMPPTTITVRGRPRTVSSYIRDPMDDAPYLPPPVPPAPPALMASMPIPIYGAQPLTFSPYFRTQTSASGYLGQPQDNSGYLAQLHTATDPRELVMPNQAQSIPYNNDAVLNLTNKTTKKRSAATKKATASAKKANVSTKKVTVSAKKAAASTKKAPASTKKTSVSTRKPACTKKSNVIFPSAIPPSEEALDATGPYDFSNRNIDMVNVDMMPSMPAAYQANKDCCKLRDKEKDKKKYGRFYNCTQEVVLRALMEEARKEMEENARKELEDNGSKANAERPSTADDERERRNFIFTDLGEDAHLGDGLMVRSGSDTTEVAMEVEDVDQLLNANGLTGANGILSTSDIILGQSSTLMKSNVFSECNNAQSQNNESNNNVSKSVETKEPPAKNDEKIIEEHDTANVSKIMNLRQRNVQFVTVTKPAKKNTNKNVQKKETAPKNCEVKDKKKKTLSKNDQSKGHNSNFGGGNNQPQNDPGLLPNVPLLKGNPGYQLNEPTTNKESQSITNKRQTRNSSGQVKAPEITYEGSLGVRIDDISHFEKGNNQPQSEPVQKRNPRSQKRKIEPTTNKETQVIANRRQTRNSSGQVKASELTDEYGKSNKIPKTEETKKENNQDCEKDSSSVIVIDDVSSLEVNMHQSNDIELPVFTVESSNAWMDTLELENNPMKPFSVDSNGMTILKFLQKDKTDKDFKLAGHRVPAFECNHCTLLFVDRKRFMIHIKWHENYEKMVTVLRRRQEDRSVLQVDESSAPTCVDSDNSISNEVKPKTRALPKRKCEACDEVFPNWKEMMKHKRTVHVVVQVYSCDQCPKTFKFPRSLQKHQDTHLEKTHPCGKCDKKFGSQLLLSIHSKTHDGKVKKFQCTYCPKAYYDSHALGAHERTHTNERPFSCDICHTTFGTTSGLKRHIKVSHNAAKPHECPVCHRSFSTSNIRDRHQVRFHGAPELLHFSCTQCASRFMSDRDLAKHCRKIHNISRRRRQR